MTVTTRERGEFEQRAAAELMEIRRYAMALLNEADHSHSVRVLAASVYIQATEPQHRLFEVAPEPVEEFAA
jgi:hypothetical protein